ncbi:hypothetical protein VL15_11035 [Burkholderia cepacia]|uniref:Tn3 transposase DDE domain-containing protein n=1 Tax=Burkholderia cepacia TaxID=292 RepID=A0A0J5X811_BURCE|nr:Tn3 family transposase [Burkholderia cepacia]KML59142.1 hypothetical protein VL15_11035 [Burkholderia cepacia]
MAFVNGGKLRVHTEAKQQLWSECARPIADAIIQYKTALLSRVREQKCATDDKAAMAFIAGVSPLAAERSRSVNFMGCCGPI